MVRLEQIFWMTRVFPTVEKSRMRDRMEILNCLSAFGPKSVSLVMKGWSVVFIFSSH